MMQHGMTVLMNCLSHCYAEVVTLLHRQVGPAATHFAWGPREIAARH